MQTYLEKKGIEKREEDAVKNIYNSEDVYDDKHPNTTCKDNGPKGKGTGKGHKCIIPNYLRGTGIDYSNLDTSDCGGEYDIKGFNGIGGREYLKNISLYNANNEYGSGSNTINTDANNGQIRF